MKVILQREDVPGRDGKTIVDFDREDLVLEVIEKAQKLLFNGVNVSLVLKSFNSNSIFEEDEVMYDCLIKNNWKKTMYVAVNKNCDNTSTASNEIIEEHEGMLEFDGNEDENEEENESSTEVDDKSEETPVENQSLIAEVVFDDYTLWCSNNVGRMSLKIQEMKNHGSWLGFTC